MNHRRTRRMTMMTPSQRRSVLSMRLVLYPVRRPLLEERLELFTDDPRVVPRHFSAARTADRRVCSLARDEDGIARFRYLERAPYRLPAVHNDLRRFLHAVRDVVDDLSRVFVVRVFVGEYDLGAPLICDAAHDRPLPRVAPSASRAQNADLPRVLVCVVEGGERIRRVRVVNHHGEILLARLRRARRGGGGSGFYPLGPARDISPA